MRQKYNLLKNWCQLYLTKENLYKVLKLYIIESTSNKMLLISSLIINMFFIYLFGLLDKIMLVIEDIDRMQYEGYHDILRICSSLNTYCNFRDRILGVISFSSKEMIELEKDKLREMNYPNDESEIEQKAVRNFNEFRKKI